MTGQGTEVRFPDLEVIHMDFHLHCPSVQMAMHEALKKTCRNEELSPARQRPDLLLQNLCIEDKNPHNSLSRCYCRPLFESVSSNTFFGASSIPSLSVNFENAVVFPSGSSTSSSRALCFRISSALSFVSFRS